ncbi:growth hormone receptor [Pelobates cultripes]|uniref:Growth hormone receptor n=1 Tax=Pelobates cultripes TaxID=61616 RepID=A0AAD1WBL0_PELCU|nr:growth hormone receptor [Pelobates cultripes]
MALWLILVSLALASGDESFPTEDVILQKPSITKCRSPEMETFTCRWTYGDFHNLSSPGLLKLIYMKNDELDWVDCPDNVTAGENSCYFDKAHTSTWWPYRIHLISEDVLFDKLHFSVEDIVIPDPPVDLNWTLLSISDTLLRVDLKLKWSPPPSADVKSGWIKLEYEVHYQELNSTKWIVVDSLTTTTTPLYALRIGIEHLVKIRARQTINKQYGDFSDVLHIPAVTVPEPTIPWMALVISGLCIVLVILIFIIIFKKKRLKILILPPVPVPKIKGIDPDLLQKGKLDEVNFILSRHEDSYKQELCNEDPWVEFIELDLEDPDDKTEGSDTDRLLGEEHLNSHSCLGVKDDDSGRASCCEPDIPDTDFSNSDTCDGISDTGHPQTTKENEEDLLCLNEKSNIGSPIDVPNTEDLNRNPEDKMWPLLVSRNESMNLPSSTQIKTKSGLDFYALVSDITPAGRLLLSPGQRLKTENEECHEPANLHPPNQNEDNAYICESAIAAFCAVNTPSTRESEPSVQQNCNDSYFTTESLNIAAMNFCPADKPPSSPADESSNCETPVPDYTSVHIINSPQSLVLNTTMLPDKACLAPCGYMSTDQVKKAMP